MHHVPYRPALFAILLAAAVFVPSCRENTLTGESSTGISYRPVFRIGDRVRYGLYDISPSGVILQSTKRRCTWTVTATSAFRNGRSGVTVFVDSTAGRPVDSLLYCFEPGGDVYLYGFLAGIQSLRSGPRIPAGWDRVATFASGTLVQWQVGTLDPGGEDLLYGELRESLEYVVAPVDGQNTLFPAYRVDFTGASVDGSMWFAENPPCLPVMFVSFWMDTTGRGRWLEEVLPATP